MAVAAAKEGVCGEVGDMDNEDEGWVKKMMTLPISTCQSLCTGANIIHINWTGII